MMVKLYAFVLTLSLAILFVCSHIVNAQQKITPEKRALILEIKELSNFGGYAVKSESKSTNVGDLLISMVEKDKSLNDDQKKELRKFALEGKERIEKQIGEFFTDKNLSDQIVGEAFIQLYDSNFTESELQELVAFYRTPTGRKAMNFQSGFSNKLSKTIGDVLSQKFREFIQTKINEEVKMLDEQIKKVKEKPLLGD